MNAEDLLASVRTVLRVAADHSKRLYIGNNSGASLHISDRHATDTICMTLPLPTLEKDDAFDFDYTTADLIADIECNHTSYGCLEAATAALAGGDPDACARAEAVLRDELDLIAESCVYAYVQ